MSAVQRTIARGYMIDTNRANSAGRLPHMNQLEKWRDDGVIELIMSDTVRDEIAAGGSALQRRVDGQIFTIGTELNQDEEGVRSRIASIIVPDGAKTPNQNQRNDVEIVFQAKKYMRALITDDGASRRQPGGILGNRDQLLRELGIQVWRDEEAVEEIRKLIRARDELARWHHREMGDPLPDWVGVD